MRVSLAACFALLMTLAPPASGQVWEVGQKLYSYGTADLRYGEVLAVGNFNGDAYQDLLVGSPHTAPLVGGVPAPDAGSILLYLGSPSGLQNPYSLVFGPVTGDRLGAAVAAVDLDDDDRDEIIIGVPGKDHSSVTDAGQVYVWELDADQRLQYVGSFSQGLNGVGGVAESGDQFGSALIGGDFNDDGIEDLAVGTPFEDQELPANRVNRDAGAVIVIFGQLDLRTPPYSSQVLFEGSSPVGGARFGSTLAAGDFDDDGRTDLAVGSPFRTLFSAAANAQQPGAGEVRVFAGTAAGLDPTPVQIVNRSSLGREPSADEHFGAALAAADFEFNLTCIFFRCYTDLAVGVPGADVSSNTDAGEVVVLYGGANYLELGSPQFLRQGTADGITFPEGFDNFGSALATGNLDARFGIDLAVGAAGENWTANASTNLDQGTVHLFFGGDDGLLTYPTGQGLVQKAGYLSAPGDSNDRFGHAIAVGNFDRNGHGTLAVGVPGWDRPDANNSGAIQVLPGALFADGWESGGFDNWSTVVP